MCVGREYNTSQKNVALLGVVHGGVKEVVPEVLGELLHHLPQVRHQQQHLCQQHLG